MILNQRSLAGRNEPQQPPNDRRSRDHEEEQQNEREQETESAHEDGTCNSGEYPRVAYPVADRLADCIAKLLRIHWLAKPAHRPALEKRFGEVIERSLQISCHMGQLAAKRWNS